MFQNNVDNEENEEDDCYDEEDDDDDDDECAEKKVEGAGQGKDAGMDGELLLFGPDRGTRTLYRLLYLLCYAHSQRTLIKKHGYWNLTIQPRWKRPSAAYPRFHSRF